MTYRFRGKKYPVAGLIGLLPALLVYGAVILYPIGNMVYTSLFDWNGIPGTDMKFVGLGNYITFFGDYMAEDVVRNMGILFCAHLVFTVPVSFFLATIINRKFRGLRIVKGVYFMPVVINRVAIGMMFTFLVYPKIGPVTVLIKALGFGSVNVLGNLNTAMFAVAFVEVWMSVGLYMILFLSGMVAIPQDMYEAADIDGASPTQRLFRITIPALKQTFRTVLVLVLTGAFKVFDVVMTLTGGGPRTATETAATAMYKTAFLNNKFGYADAIATMTVLVCLIITVLFNIIFRDRD